MPRSKRQKVVNLTSVKKKGREAKDGLIEQVQTALDEYKSTYVVSFENMRAGPFKSLQREMREDSKFFLGKNKVMGVGLGRTPEDEHADNSHLLNNYLHGQVCLLFSNLKKEELLTEFKGHEVADFATAGTPALHTVHLAKGTESLEQFGHSMEPHLRTLGLPTKLNFQKIELLADVFVCREGQILNVEQAKILKLLGHKMGTFKLKILCHRSTKGKFTEYDEGAHFLTQYNAGEGKAAKETEMKTE